MVNNSVSVRSGQELERLINLMAKLPGFGQRSARRAVLQMVNKRETLLEPLSFAISEVSEKVCQCIECGNLGTQSICSICSDSRRDNSKLCIVSEISDLWAMERAKIFDGKFYVLGGVLSALDGVGPADLKIPNLIDKVKKNEISEIILALSATIDGQTTAHYIADQLAICSVSITSLAHGVPVGGELDYLDDGTLNIAFQSRKKF